MWGEAWSLLSESTYYSCPERAHLVQGETLGKATTYVLEPFPLHLGPLIDCNFKIISKASCSDSLSFFFFMTQIWQLFLYDNSQKLHWKLLSWDTTWNRHTVNHALRSAAMDQQCSSNVIKKKHLSLDTEIWGVITSSNVTSLPGHVCR